MNSERDENRCIFCKVNFDEEKATVVYPKGLATIQRTAKKNNDVDLLAEIDEKTSSGVAILVHTDCRKRFTDKRKSEELPTSSKKSRSEFKWKELCFICGKSISRQHPSLKKFCQVMTLEIKERVFKRASERDDDWGKTVKDRLLNSNDLVAEEAIYHRSCMTNFSLNKSSVNEKPGRPVNTEMSEGFEAICIWLEEDGDCDLHTIDELQEKIKEMGYECYSNKRLKQKLKEKYTNSLTFSESCGRVDILCFKDFANYVLREKKKEKEEDTKESIIKAAAKIIKSEIREIKKSNNYYPTNLEVQDLEACLEWIPDSLRILLKIIMPNLLKQTSIGHSIIQAARPRSIICPIQFGLGVQLDRAFGSKWLISHLHKLGFSISPDEVRRFKHSAVVSDAAEANENKEVEESDEMETNTIDRPGDRNDHNTFVQWSADNVDHNIVTLTGKGTFHGMGIISMSDNCTNTKTIKRLDNKIKSSDFGKLHDIRIHQYLGSSSKGLAALKYETIKHLSKPLVMPREISYDLLWHMSRLFRREATPNWSGFMQDTVKEKKPVSKSTVTFLPIIDLNPNDEHCIYSTLLFVMEEAKRLRIAVPCVTFDQPLWLKACGIVEESGLGIVVRLGGFHTLMSYLGAIGKVMKGSGIEELFNEVYAENTIQHIISGKAISRALRAHLLAESALVSMLMETVIEDVDTTNVTDFINALEDKSLDEIELFCQSSEFQKIDALMEKKMLELKERSRTAKLWLQYLYHISVLKRFIIAERTSNWFLHLQSTTDMLNLFAASGHLNYAKSARLYVQQMVNLGVKHAWLSKQFENEKHAVRRSERYWAGLWTDLIIEQTMMRSVKTAGGLTRGRGMKEGTRHLWTLSLNHSTSINDAMKLLGGSSTKNSEQHIDLGPSRLKQDHADWQTFRNWLKARNPFTFEDANLHSLSTGFISISGEDEINCDEAERIGTDIQATMDGKSITEVKFKRKDQAKPLDWHQNTVTINEVKVYINSTALFTRLAAVAKREENEEHYFHYEMTNEPMSLFKQTMMRKPDKSSLRKALVSDEESIQLNLATNRDKYSYVIDGGALLHRMCWVRGSTFQKIVTCYVQYVRKHYGKCYIVFDGYESTSTKTTEQQRRGNRFKKCPVSTLKMKLWSRLRKKNSFLMQTIKHN